MLDTYIQKFKNLNTDRGKHRWSARSNHRAPHKPFLLLSVMDLIEQERITSNFIEPSFELVETFNDYWTKIMGPGMQTSMAYPFFFLKSEGFWHLLPTTGDQAKFSNSVKSMNKVREIFAGAQIDEDLFQLMQLSDSRQKLRTIILTTYFAPQIQPAIIEQWMVNYGAYEYSQELLRITELKETLDSIDEADDQKKKVRDQGFRKAIVNLYDHRCALCGIRMLTPEGHTVVEAAHIKPWSRSHDDRPTNGMALCKLCHWHFDEGLVGVGNKYEVLVSKRVSRDHNLPGHLMTLSGRNIFRPDKEEYWPKLENITWHRKAVFLN